MNPENPTELFTSEPAGGFRADPIPDSQAASPPQAPARRPGREELLGTLERLERTLDEMRGGLDATAREDRHREFSLPRLIGAILQVLVTALVLWALSDWLFGELNQVLIKIGFAGVLQLAALTAFLPGRDSGAD